MIKDCLAMLKQVAQNRLYIDDELKWYLFGSAAKEKHFFSDIDILIIYKSRINLDTLKTQLESIELKHPLDIIFLSEKEEKELNFVNTVHGIRINN